MKVKVRNITIDSSKEPVMITFKNDDQRKEFIDNLNKISSKEGEGVFIECPSQMTKDEINEFKYSNENDSDLSFKDKYIRLYAEFENYKRRSLKEKDEIRESTKASIISTILDLDSDLNIALKQIKNDNDKKGLELMISKISRFLSSHNIEPIQTTRYDSDIHEVISVVETGEKEKVVDVVSKGYTLNGKPIRYPKVILSK